MHLHFSFRPFLSNNNGFFLVKFAKYEVKKTAVSIILPQLNVTSANQVVHLPMTLLTHKVTWLTRSHRCMKPLQASWSKKVHQRIRIVYWCQNDNHSPGPGPGRLVPSSHQRSELSEGKPVASADIRLSLGQSFLIFQFTNPPTLFFQNKNKIHHWKVYFYYFLPPTAWF